MSDTLPIEKSTQTQPTAKQIVRQTQKQESRRAYVFVGVIATVLIMLLVAVLLFRRKRA